MAGEKVWNLVLAGGSARRFGRAKQFELLGSERLVDRVIRTGKKITSTTVLVLPEGSTWDGEPVERTVDGGRSHMESARCGIAAIDHDVDIVLISVPSHPLASAELCARLVEKLRASSADAVAPVEPLPDALKVIDRGRITQTQSRDNLAAVPFPAAFRASTLRRALDCQADGSFLDYAEELEAVEAIGGEIFTIENEPANLHITTPVELEMARLLLPLVDGPS